MHVVATLIKTMTNDGLFEIWEDIPIGKEYIVDLNSIEIAEGYNVKFNTTWKKEIIYTYDGEWMPTELLSFPREKGN